MTKGSKRTTLAKNGGKGRLTLSCRSLEVVKGKVVTGYGNRNVKSLMKGKTWGEQEVGEANEGPGE